MYTIELYEPGTSNLIVSASGSVNSDNSLAATQLPAGAYDVFVKLSGYLKKGFGSVVIGSGSNSLNGGSFIPGDLNDDNSIDIQDYGIFAVNYGKSLGDPGYNSMADMNCDDTIGIADFGIFSLNYGQDGMEAPLSAP